MAKKYKSVLELARSLTDDKTFHKEVKDQLSRKALSKSLLVLRSSRNVTQKDMAARIKCTQSKISKLENSDDQMVQVSDLIAYAMALNLRLEISFHQRRNAVENVKYHAFKIKEHLEILNKLACRDDNILDGVTKFYNEALYNILHIFNDGATRLKASTNKREAIMEVRTPAVCDDLKVTAGDK